VPFEFRIVSTIYCNSPAWSNSCKPDWLIANSNGAVWSSQFRHVGKVYANNEFVFWIRKRKWPQSETIHNTWVPGIRD
jgi:hypothetical protein